MCLMVTILEPHKIQQNTFSSVYACIFQQPIQSCIRWMSNTKMLFSGKNCISMHIYGKFLHRFLGVLCNINVAYILEFYCCLFVQIQSMKLGLFAPKRFDTVLRSSLGMKWLPRVSKNHMPPNRRSRNVIAVLVC